MSRSYVGLLLVLGAICGSSRAVLVAYLLPAFALVYGSAFLDERLTVEKLVGLLLILGGVGLGAGAARLPGRAVAWTSSSR